MRCGKMLFYFCDELTNLSMVSERLVCCVVGVLGKTQGRSIAKRESLRDEKAFGTRVQLVVL